MAKKKNYGDRPSAKKKNYGDRPSSKKKIYDEIEIGNSEFSTIKWVAQGLNQLIFESC